VLTCDVTEPYFRPAKAGPASQAKATSLEGVAKAKILEREREREKEREREREGERDREGKTGKKTGKEREREGASET